MDSAPTSISRPRVRRARFTTTTPPDRLELLRHIGHGSVALGVMRALDAWEILHRAHVELSSSTEPPAAV